MGSARAAKRRVRDDETFCIFESNWTCKLNHKAIHSGIMETQLVSVAHAIFSLFLSLSITLFSIMGMSNQAIKTSKFLHLLFVMVWHAFRVNLPYFCNITKYEASQRRIEESKWVKLGVIWNVKQIKMILYFRNLNGGLRLTDYIFCNLTVWTEIESESIAVVQQIFLKRTENPDGSHNTFILFLFFLYNIACILFPLKYFQRNWIHLHWCWWWKWARILNCEHVKHQHPRSHTQTQTQISIRKKPIFWR